MFKEDRFRIVAFLYRYNSLLGFLEPLTNVAIGKKGYVIEIEDGDDGSIRKYDVSDDGAYVADEKDFSFPVKFLDAYLYKLALDVYDMVANDLSVVGVRIGREEEVSDVA